MSQPPATFRPSGHPPDAGAYDAPADHSDAAAYFTASDSAAFSYQGYHPEQYGLPPSGHAYPQYPPAVGPASTSYTYPPYPSSGTPAVYTNSYPQHSPAIPSTSGYESVDHSSYHHQYAQWYPPPQEHTYPAYHQPYPHTYPASQPQATYPYDAQAAHYSQSTYTWPEASVTQGQSFPADTNQAPYWQAVNQSQATSQPQAAFFHQTAFPTPNLEGNRERGQEKPNEGEHPAKRQRMSSFSDTPAEANTPAEAEKVVEEEPAGPGVVWVWDLDETLIIFQSMLTGKYADLEGLDAKRKAEGLKLGEQWERLILDISDTAMFFEQVEDIDQPSIGHVTEFDDGASIGDFDFAELKLEKPLTDAGRQKLAYLYRHIQGVYKKGASYLLTGEKRAEWQALYGATDRYTGGWLSAGRRLLAECASARLKDPDQTSPGVKEPGGSLPGKPTIVLVSAGQLIPTLTKCLLFRLDPWIDPANVYSSKVAGKLQCFEWVHKRFGKGETDTKFCVVGDGVEEQAAARMMTWPFLRVASGLDPEMRLPKVKIEQLLTLLSNPS